MTFERRPIGFIADDITGATDLASALSAKGLDTRLAFGSRSVSAGGDAIVVALKIRSVPAVEASYAAVAAAEALRAVGTEQLFFKYCSTFDSTPAGNIGPVADALIDLTGAQRVVHSPSYPDNGRTVYLGHLFVGQELLSDSPMRHHPLNPMTDARLLRLLGAQTRREVSLLPFATVSGGTNAVANLLARLAADHTKPRHVIADAVQNADLESIAAATSADRLAAGAAAYGAAFGAAAHARPGPPSGVRPSVKIPSGPAAILAGSMSRATREQVRQFEGSTLSLSVAELVDGDVAVRRALGFATRRLSDGPVLIATEPHRPGQVAGTETSVASAADVSRGIEVTMGRIGLALQQLGVRRLIVAGGETSGAVADALALQSAKIGPDISTGVPWIIAEDRDLAVAFKSGNFGGPTFFRDALKAAGS